MILFCKFHLTFCQYVDLCLCEIFFSYFYRCRKNCQSNIFTGFIVYYLTGKSLNSYALLESKLTLGTFFHFMEGQRISWGFLAFVSVIRTFKICFSAFSLCENRKRFYRCCLILGQFRVVFFPPIVSKKNKFVRFGHNFDFEFEFLSWILWKETIQLKLKKMSQKVFHFKFGIWYFCCFSPNKTIV